MRGSQKQRQQLSLRQKSYLATRALILEQPLSGFDMLIDRLAAGSTLAEKRPLGDSSSEAWGANLDNIAGDSETSAAEVIVNELVDRDLIDETETEIARFVTSDLNAHGFFTKPLASYAASLGTDAASVRHILTAIQTLEPAGLGARDVSHAFAMQMSRVLPSLPIQECARFLRTRQRSMSPGVVRACLSKMHMPCDVSTMQAILGVLDPDPIKRLAPGQPHVVVPDIVIERDPLTGELACLIPLPPWTLGIDPAIANAARDPQIRKQASRESATVRWIDDAIAERTSMLTSIGNSLVASLSPYFSGRADSPSRIPVEQLMRETGMSRTVMVRALHNKYVRTPRGTFRLHSLVMDRWQTRAASAREAVALLLQPDGSHAPLSDREIADRLMSQGITISRRTVAKYRLALGIPARYFRNN
ncbi:MAG: RNA polymerase factor sigma-54 [Candidatus Cryosericum sp.]